MKTSTTILIAILVLAFVWPVAGQSPGTPSLDSEVKRILEDSDVLPGTIPEGYVSLDNNQTYAVAYQWYLVQEDLEKLFQRRLKLDYRPKLFLVVRESCVDGLEVAQFALKDPGQPVIVDTLTRHLGVKREFFDSNIKLYGETSNCFINEFVPELISDGVVDMAKVQSAIQRLLQSDAQLADGAKKLHGAFKPVHLAGDLVPLSSMHVVTQWQPLASNSNRRIYWRATISLAFQPEGHFELETLIELGELLSSQSMNQIRKFTDSNRLGSFDVVEPASANDIAVVKYKMVATSPAEKLLTEDARKQFGVLAPLLWNKVKDTLHVDR